MLDIRSFSMPVGWEESAAPCPLDGGINNQTYHAFWKKKISYLSLFLAAAVIPLHV